MRLTVVVLLALPASMLWLYCGAPLSNCDLDRFDCIIVLGTPANPDGTPTELQRQRVDEAVAEYRRGRAPAMIISGAAAHTSQVEAEVMAGLARAEGVPGNAILLEPQAHDTIQNALYSVKLMQSRGWTSAEVVTSPSHLARAGLIFSKHPIRYRMHSALGHEAFSRYLREIRATAWLRLAP